MRGVLTSFTHTYDDIISVPNLLCAWQEFVRGKRYRVDVQEFQLRLMDNILELHYALKSKTYRHGGYEHFVVTDPKRRDIHKASVRDRLVHHALYRILYPYFDTRFIHDSYSCRTGKGTHKAIAQFKKYARKVSKNHTQSCWVFKCDIRKFFASIDQIVLVEILKRHISDTYILWLLQEVITSFEKGLPLGNLTSQLLVNIYMNEFDQYVKHKLKVKNYIRYADDFVVLSQDKNELKNILSYMIVCLRNQLKLELHPNKVTISNFACGVDYLGWVHFPHRRVLRTVTTRRITRRLADLETSESTRKSYCGLLAGGDAYRLRRGLKLE